MDVLLLLPLFGGLAGGGAVYALVRRDVGTRRATLVAAVTFLALGLGWFLALYGVVAALAAAILAYVVARSRIGTDRALLAVGGSYCAVLLYAGLETMRRRLRPNGVRQPAS